MTPDLLHKYVRPVPRYTSYPTAPHFGPAVDAATYRRWLAGLDPAQPLSLYVHIPFCNTLCWFCGCHTRVVNRYEPVARYLAWLRREIDGVAAVTGPAPVTHIHFGGGSPTIAAPGDFRDLMAHLRDRFRIRDDAEIAVEIDPRGMTPDKVEALAAAGVTRASLGVQDFDPAVQRAINRVQPFALTAGVVDMLRSRGIDRINLDLMYGLPLQTEAGVAGSADKALALEPARVALFGYAHVPWMKRHQRLIAEQDLPGAWQRWRQFRAAAGRLQDAGYVAIGLDHFAHPEDSMARALAAGRLSRNFQGYTTDSATALIGFGASAIGSLPQGYVQNDPDVPAYGAAMEEGRLATVRGHALTRDDRLRRDLIERLMCDGAADVTAVCERHGADPGTFEGAVAALAPVQEDGLVEIDGSRIAVTPLGRPLVRVVCAAFDRYLQSGAGKHSSAV